MCSRSIAAARLMVFLALEAGAVALLRGQNDLDWRHLGRWVSTTPADEAVVAVVGVVALALSIWLLASTAAYLLARLTRVPSLVRGTAWATLPALRRVVDAALAASLAGGIVVAHPVGAQVPAPPIVVELGPTTSAAGHIYVPVPAGDHAEPARTTVVTLAPPPQVEAPAPAPVSGRTYAVVPGDNLWTIAAAELSRQSGRDPNQLTEAEVRTYWLTVIAANRAHLRSGDPNLIHPGEPILCPPASLRAP